MKAQLLTPTPENIRKAAGALQNHEVVGMPTETVYGLAGVAFDEKAVARIFDTKERPTFDPLIVHIAESAGFQLESDWLDHLDRQGIVRASGLSAATREQIQKLARTCWPGPLTLVLPRGSRIPDLVTSGLPTVAIRMPRHPVAQALIRETGAPLAAPSANRFGRISPTSAQAVMEELGDRIPLILDGGDCEVGVESTVLSFIEPDAPRLLRPGGVSADEIGKIIGTKALPATSAIPQPRGLSSPGMLTSHYAPGKPLRILPAPLSELSNEDFRAFLAGMNNARHLGILLLMGHPRELQSLEKRLGAFFGNQPRFSIYPLSRDGKLDEVARNLFARMRNLDSNGDIDAMIAEPVTTRTGLGHAIADRLERASAEAKAGRR